MNGRVTEMAGIMRTTVLAVMAVLVLTTASQAAKPRVYKIDVKGQSGYLELEINTKDKTCSGSMKLYSDEAEEMDTIEGTIIDTGQDACFARLHYNERKSEFNPEVQFEIEMDGIEYVYHGYLNTKWNVIAGWYRQKGYDIIEPWYGRIAE